MRVGSLQRLFALLRDFVLGEQWQRTGPCGCGVVETETGHRCFTGVRGGFGQRDDIDLGERCAPELQNGNVVEQGGRIESVEGLNEHGIGTSEVGRQHLVHVETALYFNVVGDNVGGGDYTVSRHNRTAAEGSPLGVVVLTDDDHQYGVQDGRRGFGATSGWLGDTISGRNRLSPKP